MLEFRPGKWQGCLNAELYQQLIKAIAKEHCNWGKQVQKHVRTQHVENLV